MWKIPILEWQRESLPEAYRAGAYDHFFDQDKYNEWNKQFKSIVDESTRILPRDKEVIQHYKNLMVPPIVERRRSNDEIDAYRLIKYEFHNQRDAICNGRAERMDCEEDYMDDEMYHLYRQLDIPPLVDDPWAEYYSNEDLTVHQAIHKEWEDRYQIILNAIKDIRS